MQVEALLVTPLTAPARPASAAAVGGAAAAGSGGKVWTGSADGSVWAWPDAKGTGQMGEAEGKLVKVEGGKGTAHHCDWPLPLDSSACSPCIRLQCRPRSWARPQCGVCSCAAPCCRGTRVFAHAVKSLAHCGEGVWVGMEDGRIHALRLSDATNLRWADGL